MFCGLKLAIRIALVHQVCFKYAGDCNLPPDWAGVRDDSDFAYENLGVVEAEKCLDRAVS
jgi:hypothetical protein